MIASVADDRTVELTAAIPMGRYTGPRETAAAVPFLASEEAGYFTDAILPVDGGLSI
jgi:NAD(P)-dependent dehydrogenase (short-subunit alcohol dehydrogenase family)